LSETQPQKPYKLIGLAVAIIIIAAFFVFLGSTRITTKTTQLQQPLESQQPTETETYSIDTQEPEQQKVIDPDTVEWKTFVSELGFSFDYPSHWGTPTEKVLDAVEALQGDTGKTYQLTFSKTKEVYASGRSVDFSAGRGGQQEDFGVNSNGKTSIEAYLDIVDPGCFTMGTQNSFRALVDFSLTDKPIGGVRLFLPIVSGEMLNQFEKDFDLETEAIDCFRDTKTHQQLIGKGDEIRTILLTKNNLDSETAMNLDIFAKIASSSAILQ